MEIVSTWLERELKTSLEVGGVAFALAQADAALKSRPMPERLGELHPDVRKRLQDTALIALMLLNRDATVYAERVAADSAFETVVQFCKDHDLDWLADDNPVNDGDALEMLIHRCARKAVIRFCQVLAMNAPGLASHLRKLEAAR